MTCALCGGPSDHTLCPGCASSAATHHAGRRGAQLRAVGWSVPFAGVMFASAYVVAGVARAHHVESALHTAYSPAYQPVPPYRTWLLLAGGLCWAICATAEIVAARRLGADYPALGPLDWAPGSELPRRARRALGRIDRSLSEFGGGCLTVAALAAAGPLVVLGWSFFSAAAIPIWSLAVAAATVLHLWTVRVRLDTRRPEGAARQDTARRDGGPPGTFPTGDTP